MNEVISTDHLSKNFGNVNAVDNISIKLQKGEIYGFLGLNGAGKTTTIRMMMGMISPTSGYACLFGNKINGSNGKLWNRVGYLVEVPYAYPELTVKENLEIFRRMRFIRDKQAVTTVMEKLKLTAYRDRKAKNLSLGNAQRLGLAKALIHNPEILILDEPANGLDPAGIVEIRELLSHLSINQGVTIFISSHILNEISRFATRIGIIHEGRLMMESSMDELDKKRIRSLHLKTRDLEGAKNLLLFNGYDIVSNKNDCLEIAGKDAVSLPEKIASIMVNNGFPPSLLKVDEEELESFFLRTIKEGGMK